MVAGVHETRTLKVKRNVVRRYARLTGSWIWNLNTNFLAARIIRRIWVICGAGVPALANTWVEEYILGTSCGGDPEIRNVECVGVIIGFTIREAGA